MISITKKQKIFLWMLTPVFILLSLGSLETSPVLSGFWFLSFVVAVFLALSSSSKNSSDKNSETAKPNILILLPVYLLLEGKDPFADLTKDKGDAKLNAIGTYAVLYKIYCYNKLLAQKFGKDIYLSTIIEKQREKIAAADLAISEHFVAQMRMFQELEVLKERENSEFEGLLAFTLIRREEEFSDVKDDDDFGGPLWMMKITDIFKEENKTIEEYFKLYWKNSGFNQRELESWLSQNS